MITKHNEPEEEEPIKNTKNTKHPIQAAQAQMPPPLPSGPMVPQHGLEVNAPIMVCRTPLDRGSPMTPSSGTLSMPLKCTEKALQTVNGILNCVTRSQLQPMVLALLRLMHNERISLVQVVPLLFKKAINQGEEMSGLYADFCTSLVGPEVTREQLSGQLANQVRAMLFASVADTAGPSTEELKTALHTEQLGCIRFCGQLFKQDLFSIAQLLEMLDWLLHTARRKALAALSIEILCTVLTSAAPALQEVCPMVQQHYVSEVMALSRQHSPRLQVLSMDLCKGMHVHKPDQLFSGPVLMVHNPYAL